jgi:hypothetical protein
MVLYSVLSYRLSRFPQSARELAWVGGAGAAAAAAAAAESAGGTLAAALVASAAVHSDGSRGR